MLSSLRKGKWLSLSFFQLNAHTLQSAFKAEIEFNTNQSNWQAFCYLTTFQTSTVLICLDTSFIEITVSEQNVLELKKKLIRTPCTLCVLSDKCMWPVTLSIKQTGALLDLVVKKPSSLPGCLMCLSASGAWCFHLTNGPGPLEVRASIPEPLKERLSLVFMHFCRWNK